MCILLYVSSRRVQTRQPPLARKHEKSQFCKLLNRTINRKELQILHGINRVVNFRRNLEKVAGIRSQIEAEQHVTIKTKTLIGSFSVPGPFFRFK